MALCGLHLRNYRAFVQPTELELRPLTLFFGPNNAGKSSLLAALPLVREGVLPGAQGPLALSSRAARGGSFHDLRSHLSSSPTIELELRWDDDLVAVRRLALLIRDLPDQHRQVIAELRAYDASQTLLLHLDWVLAEEVPQPDQPERYDLTVPGIRLEFPLRFSGLLPDAPLGEVPAQVTGALGAVRARLLSLASSVHWLSAERAPLLRSARYVGSPSRQLRPDGGGTAELLAADKRGAGGLLAEVSGWYERHFQRRLDVVFSGREGGDFSLVLSPVKHPHNQVNVADTGEGIMQVLPVLTLLALTRQAQPPKGVTPLVLLEEPELHLHPQAQVQLATALCQAAAVSDPPRLVVDTHSENLYLRMLLAVAKGELPRERVAIYWVQQTADGQSTAEPVALDEGGRPRGWPPGIFAEDLEQSRQILLARRTRGEQP